MRLAFYTWDAPLAVPALPSPVAHLPTRGLVVLLLRGSQGFPAALDPAGIRAVSLSTKTATANNKA